MSIRTSLAVVALVACSNSAPAPSGSGVASTTSPPSSASAAHLALSGNQASTHPGTCSREAALARFNNPDTQHEIERAFAGQWAEGEPTSSITLGLGAGADLEKVRSVLGASKATAVPSGGRLEFGSTQEAILGLRQAFCLDEVTMGGMNRVIR